MADTTPAERRARGAPAKAPKARFFFALRPDPEACVALAGLASRLAQHFGGHPFAAGDVHLTLAFVGMRALDDATVLAPVLEGLPRHWPITPRSTVDEALALAQLGVFHGRVLWIGPADDESARGASTRFATELATQLRGRLAQAGIGFDDRALQLHLTLVRGVREVRRDDSAARALDRPIVPARWTLALGWSGPDSTPARRYAWRTAA